MRNADLKFIVSRSSESGNIDVVLSQFINEEDFIQNETIAAIIL